jgi:hypothetical protein
MVWERALAVSGAAALAVALSTAGAHAYELSSRDCDALDLADVREKFGVELALAGDSERFARPLNIEIACVGSRADLLVRDQAMETKSSVELFGLERPARSRALALALTELVLSGEMPHENAAAAESQTAGSADAVDAGFEDGAELTLSVPARERAEQPPWDTGKTRRSPDAEAKRVALQVHAVTSVRAFLQNEATFLGGGARVSSDPDRQVSLVIDGLWEQGTLGRTDVAGFTFGAFAMYNYSTPVAVLRAGVGSRVGYTDGAEATALGGLMPWGFPLAAVAASLRAGSVSTELHVEGGYTDLGGSGAESLGHGPFIGVELGLGFGFTPPPPEPRTVAVSTP